MSKWVEDVNLDLSLILIATSDQETICTVQPTTFFQAYWPNLWIASTVYSAGEIVHPPTLNDFIYECTIGGTSGAGEPAWGTSQGETFSDNTATWKTHTNVTLAATSLVSGDKVLADTENPDPAGRKLTVAEKTGSTCHVSGTVTHLAMTDSISQSLRLASLATTETIGDNEVVSGKAVVFNSFKIISPDPT